MEQQNQDTVKHGLFDFEQAALWVPLPEETRRKIPREEPEREGQVFEACRGELDWEERLLENDSRHGVLEINQSFLNVSP